MNKIKKLYEELLREHGHQGWWPINNKYTPKNYGCPRNEKEKYEVILGTILTQNTTWRNAAKALDELRRKKLIKPREISKIKQERLARIIRSAGYHNQKANYLKEITKFYLSLKGRTPTRQELLHVKGVGKETADSILLYAYKEPVFVVDKYTKRLLQREKILKKEKDYDETRKIFMDNIEKKYETYNEYHALIVQEMKTKP